METMKSKAEKQNRKPKGTSKRFMDTVGNWIVWIFVTIICYSCISYFLADAYQGHAKQTGQTIGFVMLFAVTVAGAIVFLVMSWRKSRAGRQK